MLIRAKRGDWKSFLALTMAAGHEEPTARMAWNRSREQYWYCRFHSIISTLSPEITEIELFVLKS
jgi:hypothetical protein